MFVNLALLFRLHFISHYPDVVQRYLVFISFITWLILELLFKTDLNI